MRGDCRSDVLDPSHLHAQIHKSDAKVEVNPDKTKLKSVFQRPIKDALGTPALQKTHRQHNSKCLQQMFLTGMQFSLTQTDIYYPNSG